MCVYCVLSCIFAYHGEENRHGPCPQGLSILAAAMGVQKINTVNK